MSLHARIFKIHLHNKFESCLTTPCHAPFPLVPPFALFSSLIPLFYFSEADEGFDIGFRRRAAAAAGRGGGCNGSDGGNGGRRSRRSRIIGSFREEQPAAAAASAASAAGEEVAAATASAAEQNARTVPDVQNVVPEFFDLQVRWRLLQLICCQ